MGGGHFDYGCFKISQFANELQHEIDINNDINDDNQQHAVEGRNLRDKTLERVKGVFNIIELAGDLARETEWLYSGDTSEIAYCEEVDKLIQRFQTNKEESVQTENPSNL